MVVINYIRRLIYKNSLIFDTFYRRKRERQRIWPINSNTRYLDRPVADCFNVSRNNHPDCLPDSSPS